MKDKTLIAIAAGAVTAPLVAFLVFGGQGGAKSDAPEAAQPAPAVVETRAVPPPVKEPVVLSKAAQSADVPVVRNVTPAVMEDLAQSVKLSENENATVGNKKELWAKAIPVVEKMIAFSDADCSARNWLTQFVSCGKKALDDSPDYYLYANALATMPRDNQELGSGVPSQ